MLFNPGSTYSYVCAYFFSRFNLLCDHKPILIHVSIPVGETLVVDRVYRSFLVSLVGYDTWVDIIILEMVHFDTISEMIGLLHIMSFLIVILRL